MSTETEQPDLVGVYNHNHDFLRGVVNYIEENEKFRGTAAELSRVLGSLDMNARVLSLKLEKIKSELENNGIFVKHSIIRGRHIITIANTHEIPHSEETLLHPTKAPPENQGFATPPNKEPITFPFSWQYGTIEELSEEEKNEVNVLRHNGRKHYQKTCSLCAKEGNLEYRKISDANSSLLCETCAKSYIVSAVKLLNEGVGEM